MFLIKLRIPDLKNQVFEGIYDYIPLILKGLKGALSNQSKFVQVYVLYFVGIAQVLSLFSE